MLTFLCVLKKYNKKPKKFNFEENDVYFLHESIHQNYSKKFNFFCLTDVNIIPGINVIPLTDDYDGYWSKIELFKHDFNKCVYFDLDSIILKNIDWIDDLELDEKSFWATKQLIYNENIFNSSFMLWGGDKKYIAENFNYKQIIDNDYYIYGGIDPDTKKILKKDRSFSVGDQAYIFSTLKKYNNKINYVSSDKINFYKSSDISCRKNLDILFFSGFPKLNHCTYSKNFNTYILDEAKVPDKLIHKNIITIFAMEFHNTNLLKNIYLKFCKKEYNNYNSFLIFIVSFYEKILKDLCDENTSDMYIFNKNNYLNIIQKYKKIIIDYSYDTHLRKT